MSVRSSITSLKAVDAKQLAVRVLPPVIEYEMFVGFVATGGPINKLPVPARDGAVFVV